MGKIIQNCLFHITFAQSPTEWSSGLALNPVLFFIFIINLDDRRETAPIMFEGRFKLGTDLGRNGFKKINCASTIGTLFLTLTNNQP